MRRIKLSRGKYSIVDDEDFEKVSQFKWTFGTNGYAFRNIKRDKSMIYLHRFLICPPEGMIVDHINQDKLDNRKINLRICTHSQNHANQGLQKNNTSGFRGVTKNGEKWEARVKHFGKTLHFGLFDSKIMAAKQYNKKAVELFGKFALVNKI